MMAILTILYSSLFIDDNCMMKKRFITRDKKVKILKKIFICNFTEFHSILSFAYSFQFNFDLIELSLTFWIVFYSSDFSINSPSHLLNDTHLTNWMYIFVYIGCGKSWKHKANCVRTKTRTNGEINWKQIPERCFVYFYAIFVYSNRSRLKNKIKKV